MSARTIVPWIGLGLIAVGIALGSRAAQDHAMARKAWLEVSGGVQAEGYDASDSDALYEASDDALAGAVLLVRVAGAGLVILVVGLALRRRGPRSRPRLRALLSLAAAGIAWALASFVADAIHHPLLGPLLSRSLHALAPFVAAAAAASCWVLRRGRGPAKVPASNGETT